MKEDSTQKPSLYTTNPDAKRLCSGKLFYKFSFTCEFKHVFITLSHRSPTTKCRASKNDLRILIRYAEMVCYDIYFKIRTITTLSHFKTPKAVTHTKYLHILQVSMEYKIPDLKRGRIQCSDCMFLSNMTNFSRYIEFAQNSTVCSEKQQISNFGSVCIYKQCDRCHSFMMRNPQSAMNSVHVPCV